MTHEQRRRENLRRAATRRGLKLSTGPNEANPYMLSKAGPLGFCMTFSDLTEVRDELNARATGADLRREWRAA
jgi:hypothetical protein